MNFKDRVIENYKKNKFVLLAFCIIWGLTIVGTLYFYRDTLGKQSVGNELSQNYVELNSTSSVEEMIAVSDLENCESVCVKFATYMRKNSGKVNVVVYGKQTGRVYADSTIDVNDLQDNAFYTIKLNKKLDSNIDKNISVRLSSNSENGKGVAVYYSNEKCFSESSLFVNGESKLGDLSVRFLKQSDELGFFNTFVIGWMIFGITLLLVLILLVSPKLEILFTLIALIFGLTFWVVITPMSAPDETTHYEYAFQLSNYILGEEDHLIFNEEYQNYGAFSGHHNISAAYVRLVEKINRPLNLRDTEVRMLIDIDESYTTCFVPQALGITIARLLNQNMLRTFYIGRLFNLTFYIICVYIAIKRTPIHKMLFGVMATLPIFMQQAASYSYDCWINGLSFVVISSLLKWMYQEEKISYLDVLFVFITNMLFAPIKVVYSVFTFLYWFVPEKQFKNRKQKIIITLIVMFPALFEYVRLLSPLIIRTIKHVFEGIFEKNTMMIENQNTLGRMASGYKPFYDADEVPEFTYTFSHVLEHPIETIEIFLRTIRYYLKSWFYGAFGRTLSGDTLVLPLQLVHFMLITIMLVAFREENHVESVPMKVIYVGMCVLCGLMMLGGMLISWTDRNQEIIEAFGGQVIQGVQGRYFSPLLPYFMSIFNNKKLKVPAKFDKWLLLMFFISMFETVVYVLSYTYVN